MLADVRNPHLYAEWQDYIEVSEVRDAFRFLIGLAACSKRFTCHIQWKGAVRDFRFIDAAGEQPYSFITNQKWLLFYFRPPAVRADARLRNDLRSQFDSFDENAVGEWIIKLRSISDVESLAALIEW